ncbi:MAG: MFS transporter [Pseudomonadota bacterium]
MSLSPSLSTTSDATTWRRLRLPLTATLTVQIAVNLALLSVAVLAPAIAADLQVPAAWAGYYIGLAYLAGALVSAGADRVLAPVGPMTASLAALVATVLGLLAAASGSLAGVAVGAVSIGLAYGVTNPTSSEILAASAPVTLYGRVFSIKQTAVPAGGVLAGVLAPSLALAAGWNGALQLTALLVAITILVLLPWRRRLDGRRLDRRASIGSPLTLVLADQALRRLALAGFCLAGLQLCVSTFFTAYLVEAVGLSLTLAGLLFGIVQGAGVAGRVLWGWLADRVLGLAPSVAVLAGLATLGVGALALVPAGVAVALLVVLALFLGFSVMAWTGLLIAAAVAARPDRASSITAGAMIFTFAGVVAVPPLFGVVVDASDSYAAGYVLAAGFGVLALALTWPRRSAAGNGDPR